MKRLVIAVVIAAVGIAGCGDDESPTSPSDITVFTVQLSALNEVPPITDVENTARGTAVITVNKSSNTIDFSVSLNGFPTTPTSTLTAAHIHPGAAGVNGTVLIGTGLSSSNAPSLSSGSATFTFTGVGASADSISQVLANPQNFYFNVHTSLHGGGVMRGQLR
jgi:hypothetical protein